MTYGAYIASGLHKGKWFEFKGDAKPELAFEVCLPAYNYEFKVHYQLKYEVHPSPGGRRNFYYQYTGDSR